VFIPYALATHMLECDEFNILLHTELSDTRILRLLTSRSHVGVSQSGREPHGTLSGLPQPGSLTPMEGGREGLSILLSRGVGRWLRGGQGRYILTDYMAAWGHITTATRSEAPLR